MRIYSRIVGTGSQLPAKILTNADLEKMVDTDDQWIVERTGIRERHVAAEGQYTSDLSYEASIKALEAAGLKATDLDMIVVGTTTPDLIFPPEAPHGRQRKSQHHDQGRPQGRPGAGQGLPRG